MRYIEMRSENKAWQRWQRKRRYRFGWDSRTGEFRRAVSQRDKRKARAVVKARRDALRAAQTARPS